MTLPVLLAVDGDIEGLEHVEAQLTQRYAHEYRVLCVRDPQEALRLVTQLADASEDLALLLVGKEVADTAGGEALLERVRQLQPDAKRVLLVPPGAWADPPTAEAILEAMSLGRVDHYVDRPAPALDEVFHEAVSSFLLEWASDRRVVPHTVHIVGESWEGRAYELRDVFQRCAAPHDFFLADSDRGRELLAKAGPEAKLPIMVLPDGTVLSDPTNTQIAEVAGAPGDLAEREFDLVIVGAGPAGLSAAVYGASEGLRTLVVDEGGIGGQARSSSRIRNYLGFAKGISGARLAEEAFEQASVFGASFVFMHKVAGIAHSGGQLEVSLADGRDVAARTVILSTGATYRRLDVPSLEALTGAGVFYGGPASEAPGLRGKEVFVVGGGNSAGQAALHLARYARRVTLVVRAGSLASGMSHYLLREIEATRGVEVRTGAEVVGGGGDGNLEELVLRHTATGEEERVPADALFVLIGARPNTGWLPAEIARDERGFLLTGDEIPDGRWPLERPPVAFETSMPGVLAAGDVRRSSVKRVASAVGEGSIAIQLVHGLLDHERRPAQPVREPAASAAGAGAIA